jgi:hypothetical protein
MDLSSKLKRGDIKIKKKSQAGSGLSEEKKKLSPMSENYKKFLKGGNDENNKDKSENKPTDTSSKKVNLIRPQKKEKKDSDIKIIHKKGEKNKHKFTRKKPSKINNIKDINEIERQIELSKTNNPKEQIIEKLKAKNEKGDHTKDKKDKKETKENSRKKNKRRTKRSKKRNSIRSSKKISFKNSKISQKDIHRVESKIKEIRSKKTDEIKKELEDSGIKVSGKSKRLLKDIYLYSKVCNINIQHEK